MPPQAPAVPGAAAPVPRQIPQRQPAAAATAIPGVPAAPAALPAARAAPVAALLDGAPSRNAAAGAQRVAGGMARDPLAEERGGKVRRLRSAEPSPPSSTGGPGARLNGSTMAAQASAAVPATNRASSSDTAAARTSSIDTQSQRGAESSRGALAPSIISEEAVSGRFYVSAAAPHPAGVHLRLCDGMDECEAVLCPPLLTHLLGDGPGGSARHELWVRRAADLRGTFELHLASGLEQDGSARLLVTGFVPADGPQPHVAPMPGGGLSGDSGQNRGAARGCVNHAGDSPCSIHSCEDPIEVG